MTGRIVSRKRTHSADTTEPQAPQIIKAALAVNDLVEKLRQLRPENGHDSAVFSALGGLMGTLFLNYCEDERDISQAYRQMADMLRKMADAHDADMLPAQGRA